MPNTYKMSTYLEQAILNEVLRGQNYLPPSNIHVGLFTSDPTDEDIGTEVSGGRVCEAGCHLRGTCKGRKQ